MQNLIFHASRTDVFSGLSAPVEASRYVVVGVPFDRTSTYRAGSRFAPHAIREASLNIESISLRAGLDIEQVPIHDAGDLHVVDDVSETLRKLTQVSEDIVSSLKTPVFIGGEHTITLGVVRSLPRSVGVVSLDAHGDLRDEYGGGKLSHATVLRRISELVGTDGVLVCGVRALCKEELDFIKEHNIGHFTPWEIREQGLTKVKERVKEFAGRFDQTYLTIDTDVLDPAFAPGVANPEFDGMRPDELIEIASAVARERMVGFDLVEVCPAYDNGVTAIAAARIIFEVIAQKENARKS
jgi:agmatinase